MGSSGVGYDVRAIDGKKHSSREVLYKAVCAFLVKAWKPVLSRSQLKMAKDWILLGDDSLLTVGDMDEDLEQPADNILFMYYETVSWPRELASHWLDLTLASERKAFEEMLEKHGYTLVAKNFPTMKEFAKPEYSFIVVSKKLGLPDSEGVFWQDEDGEFVEYADLPEKTRELAKATFERKLPCACPFCAHLRARATVTLLH